jgi:hypothetical protein
VAQESIGPVRAGIPDRHAEWLSSRGPKEKADTPVDAALLREHASSLRQPPRELIDAAAAAARPGQTLTANERQEAVDVVLVGAGDTVQLLDGLRRSISGSMTPVSQGTGGRVPVIDVRTDGSGSAIARLCSGEPIVAFADRPMTGRERTRCAEGSVTVLEVLAANQPFVMLTSSRNSGLARLTGEQLRALLDPTRSARPRWVDLGAGTSRMTPSVYSAPPNDSSTQVLMSLLGLRSLTDAVTYAGDAAAVKAALAGDPNGIGWVPAGEATGPGVRTVALVDGSGRSLLSDFVKPVFVYLNAGSSAPATYRQTAQAVVTALPGVVTATGAASTGEASRSTASARLARGQGGYLTVPDATAVDVVRAPPKAYLN